MVRHTHTPSSETAFGGTRLNAEMHFVFGTGSTPKAVAGIGMEYGDSEDFFSGIFGQLDYQGQVLPPVGSTDRYPVVPVFMML